MEESKRQEEFLDYSSLSLEQLENLVNSCKSECQEEKSCCKKLDKNDKFYRFNLDLKYGKMLLQEKQYFILMTTVLHKNSINYENIYNKNHEDMELLRENAIIGMLDDQSFEDFEAFYQGEIDKAVEKNSDELYKYFYNYGEYLVYMEKYEEAIQMYQNCQQVIENCQNFVEKDETLALLFTVLAFLFLCTNEIEEGLNYCDKAEKLSKKCYFIEYQRVNLFVEQQDYKNAGLNMIIWAQKALKSIGTLDQSMQDSLKTIMDMMQCEGNLMKFLKIYENEVNLFENLKENFLVLECLAEWVEEDNNKKLFRFIETIQSLKFQRFVKEESQKYMLKNYKCGKLGLLIKEKYRNEVKDDILKYLY